MKKHSIQVGSRHKSDCFLVASWTGEPSLVVFAKNTQIRKSQSDMSPPR